MKEMEYFCNYYIYKDGDKYYIEQDEDLIFNSLDAARLKAKTDPYARRTLGGPMITEDDYEADHWKPTERQTYNSHL
mgnify:FL=1|tara:strand:- start:1066 stop:1296 length:231 start_codon:yes stop_codon:yes gene_type:complete